MRVLGEGTLDILIPSDWVPFLSALDWVMLVEGLGSDPFFHEAILKAGHKLDAYFDSATFFDGRLKFRAKGNL